MYRTTVLTVAGSDSGGGAGIQADLAAFAYFDVFGTTAITAVTAQNPHEVTAVVPIPPAAVVDQMRAVCADFHVGAIKTGMLFDSSVIEAVAEVLATMPAVPVVVDPVMVATSGARLLREEAVDSLMRVLLPRATVITPNVPEAAILVGRAIETPEAAADAARELAERYGCLAVVKGGHLEGITSGDFAADRDGIRLLNGPRVDAPTTHGTGCSLSAALAACLAKGLSPHDSLHKAKAYVLGRLQHCVRLGDNTWSMAPPGVLPEDRIECRPWP